MLLLLVGVGVGVGCLVAAATFVRTAAAHRAGARLVQRTWLPGLLVGLVSGAFGAPFAPMPYVRGPARTAWIHLVAPVLVAVALVVGLAALGLA